VQYNVFFEDFNGREITTINIFDHVGFLSGCKKAYKEFGQDREKFLEQIRRELKYYFWSKAEYELVLTSLFDSYHHPFQPKKIDIFDQVTLNWPVFADYVWNNRKELSSRRMGKRNKEAS